MAILLVRVLYENSLPLNEFFDYNGYCYANYGVNILDFYEATAKTEALSDITVVFVNSEGSKIIGWYEKAEVSAKSQTISLFLEGNIKAKASDAVFLEEAVELSDYSRSQRISKSVYDVASQSEQTTKPQASQSVQTTEPKVIQPGRSYEVIECEDCRYDLLMDFIRQADYKNVMLRYPFVNIETDERSRKSLEMTRQYCQVLAGNLMEDNCNGIMDIKALEKYAKQLIKLSHNDSDGYYYHSMACYQLGLVRDAMKSIEKAIQIDGEEADFLAQKANILCSMKHYGEAQKLYKQAFLLENDEIYRIYEGRALILMGQMEQAYKIFDSVEDKQMLEDCGIATKLETMDKKWSFSKILKRLKGKNNEREE